MTTFSALYVCTNCPYMIGYAGTGETDKSKLTSVFICPLCGKYTLKRIEDAAVQKEGIANENSIYVKLDLGRGETASVHRGDGALNKTRQYKRITFSSYQRLERITRALSECGCGQLGASKYSLVIHNPKYWGTS